MASIAVTEDSSTPKEVAYVAVICNYKLLMGKRKDSGKWCCPGGHINYAETPQQGAIRELEEETGIRTWRVSPLGCETIVGRSGRKVTIHAFRTDIDERETTTKLDPDKEFTELKWVPIWKESPELRAEQLHNPRDLVLKYLGIQNW